MALEEGANSADSAKGATCADSAESTDNADSWTLRAENVGSKNAEDVTANVYAPI